MGSTYLNKTPGSAGNRRTWTWSSWVKLSSVGSNNTTDNNILLNARQDDGNLEILQFNGSTGTFMYANFTSAVAIAAFNTNAVYRDFSGWYHIVLEVDTTQATDSNRIKLYINGVQETSLVATYGGYPIYPPQNTQGWINNTVNHEIGAYNTTARFNGLMAHVHLTDGTAYDASTFGQTDAASGIWKPKTSPSVTYGTNGFFLKFANSGSLGTDSSGNGNNFTVNGTGTQTLDTPSNVFATLNPLFAGTTNATFSNGNLTYTATGTAQKNTVSTLAVSQGKWFCESKFSVVSAGYPGVGIMDSQSSLQTSISYLGSTADSYCIFANGDIYNNGSNTAIGTTFTNTDIIGLALDLDSGTKTLKIYKNGSLVYTQTVNSPANAYMFATTNNLDTSETQFNFGNGYFGTTAVASGNADGAGYGIFEYAPPTGYYALCTKNINTYG